MFLSRLMLDPRSRLVRRDLADCQQMHRTILSAFPEAPAGAKGAREHFGVLYRLDKSAAGSAVLVQSRERPDWGHLPPGYLLQGGPDVQNPACKRVLEQYDRLRSGMLLIFRLRANPARKIDTKTGADGKRRNGKRVDLRGEDVQLAWLSRKAEEGGFRLVSVRARRGVADVRVIPEGGVAGGHVGASLEHGMRRGRPLSFGAVLFEGQLQVTDAEKFRLALAEGIGPGKAYGFGLLSIAPPRR